MTWQLTINDEREIYYASFGKKKLLKSCRWGTSGEVKLEAIT